MTWLILVALFCVSYLIAALIISFQFWDMRNGGHNPTVKILALVFLAIAIFGLFDLCAAASGYRVKPVLTTQGNWFFWFGRGQLASALWFAVWFFVARRHRN